jgi:hypothetical protein
MQLVIDEKLKHKATLDFHHSGNRKSIIFRYTISNKSNKSPV